MRWVVSDLNEFRRAVSRIGIFFVLASMVLIIAVTAFPFLGMQYGSGMLPRAALFGYCLCGVAAMIFVRFFDSHPRTAIQCIEMTALIILVLSMAWIGYSLWMDGISMLPRAVFNILALVIATSVARENIAAAKALIPGG